MPDNDCILMDVDGVLLNLFPAVKQYVLDKFNVNITENMIITWDWDYALGLPLLMSTEFWDFVWNSDQYSPDKCIRPYDNAVSFVDMLKSLGFRVVAVSQRSMPSARANAERFFKLFNFDYHILCNNSMDKVRYAHEIDADWALEDNPKIAAAIGMNKSDCRSYLLTRLWNQHCIAAGGAYKRVHTYNDFIRVLMQDMGWGVA